MEPYIHLFRSHLVVLLLVSLFLVEGGSLFLSSTSKPSVVTEPIRISDIEGPRIDDAAAAIVVDGEKSVPEEIWLFLLLAYVALIVFNFSATFEKVVSPQWFWEGVYTLCALLAWFALDPTGVEQWFPLMIIKTGLILFTLYVYLLEKRLTAEEKFFSDSQI